MDAVKSFNAELSSLYDVKPPISKAKMTALTRGAIKAIKFYKHVVQSVEKFILKCKPEYKVPGLYVIDSIVRQSRHQFGTDKDVFAPRFAKNMQQTFVNLYKCPPEDKSKVIRVLNLWQKNQVFAPDVIQPLFDLADPNHPMHKEMTTMQNNGHAGPGTGMKGSPTLQKTPTKTPTSADPATLAQLGTIANNPYFQSTLDSNTIAQLQQLHRILLRQADGSAKPEAGGAQVHFDRKLLDFDYGSDEDDDPANPSPKLLSNSQAMDTVGSLLSNPEVLRQLQTLQQSMSNQNNVHTEFDLEKLRKLQEMKQQEEEFDKHLAQTLPNLPFAAECEFKPNTNSPSVFNNFFLPTDMSQPPPGYKPALQTKEDNSQESEVEFVGTNEDMEVIDIDHGDSRSPSRERYARRRRSRSRERSRDRDRDRTTRRRRSRSRSRSRTRKHRSRSRERDREREKEKEKEREKERERRKRGLPPIKKDNLSVCSTTLWVGHLSKLVHQEDLSDTFGEFGEIVSIDLIIPRGCAFIVMHRRQDAARCLTKLKNHKMQGKAITLAWAPGKGVKGKDLKDYWEGDLGVSYIPFPKLRTDMDLELLEDGGMLDEDTAPDWMKAKIATMASTNSTVKQDGVADASQSTTNSTFIQMPDGLSTTVDTSQPPPVPSAAGLLPPPPMAPLPLVAPFQLNNRLLGMPPGLMANVPMGVPPPNMPGALLQNPMLGMNSPFGQGLLAPPMAPQMGNVDKNSQDHHQMGMPRNLSEQMLSFGLMPPHPPPLSMQPSNHDDNMDVEMEDADKSDPKMSDAMMGGGSLNSSYNGDGSSMMSRRDGRDDEMPPRGRLDGREREHSRDRHDRDVSHSRDRSQRWGREGRSESRDERRDREKALNDRLREMAGDNSYREDGEPPPPLLDRPVFPGFNNGDGMPNLDQDRYRRRLDDYPGASDAMSSPRYPDYDNAFEGPPLEYDPPPLDFEGGPALEYDVPRDYDGRYPPLRGDPFDDRRRDYFQPRDGFGPRVPPRFRGPVHDLFGPRGGPPPMIRPPMFRGGGGGGGSGGRGPRPGPGWIDRQRYDGPPEFFRGPPGGFDERSRHDRPDRRRYSRHQDDIEQDGNRSDGGPSGESSGRRSNRWSNGSPSRDIPVKPELENPQPEEPLITDDTGPQQDQEAHEPVVKNEEDEHVPEGDAEAAQPRGGGNMTPLHDEPAEPSAAGAAATAENPNAESIKPEPESQESET